MKGPVRHRIPLAVIAAISVVATASWISRTMYAQDRLAGVTQEHREYYLSTPGNQVIEIAPGVKIFRIRDTRGLEPTQLPRNAWPEVALGSSTPRIQETYEEKYARKTGVDVSAKLLLDAMRRTRSQLPEVVPPLAPTDLRAKLNLDAEMAEAGHNSRAVAPANDSCGAATTVTVGSPAATLDTSCATVDPNDPIMSCGSGTNSNTVWFEFTAPMDGTLSADTCGSSYDTVLEIWDGGVASCPTPASSLGCNDDKGGGPLQSTLDICLSGGQIVLIEVADFGGPGGGTLLLNLDFNAKPNIPANDDCSNATVISIGSPAVTLDTTQATSDPNDPNMSCTFLGPAPNSNTVWFLFTAPTEGLLSVDTCGTDYDTVMSIWGDTSGCPTPSDELACNDDKSGGGLQSEIVDLCLTSGQTVLIEVADFGAPSGGTLLLNVDFLSIGCNIPDNDDFANATVIPDGTLKFADDVSTVGASNEPSDPAPSCGNRVGSNTVWYTTTSSTACRVTIDTCGSDYDTVLSVYTGSPGNFVEVACHDDKTIFTGDSTLDFFQQPGVTYSILISTFRGGESGNADFDYCCSAIAPCDAPCVTEDAWTATVDNTLASNGECEDYQFVRDSSQPIMVLDKYKVGINGYPDGISVDYFFQPCRPVTETNPDGEDICSPIGDSPNIPVLILNDIFYPPGMFPPNLIPYEVIVGVSIDPTLFPSTGTFDWWKIIEFRPAGPFEDGGPADCDNDGDLDTGAIINGFSPLNIVGRDDCRGTFGIAGLRITDCTDNYGAEVLNFLGNSPVRCVNVFEPTPPLPARSFPGVQPGENSETRPWCFTINP